jgi:flagellar protein FliO/FliZ
MIFALAIVLGLLVGVMYFIKKFMQRTAPSAENQNLINIISSRYLGPKSSIILVEVLDQIIVVGISHQQMTTLANIDDPLTVAKIKTTRSNSRNINNQTGIISRYISSLNFPSKKQKENKVR